MKKHFRGGKGTLHSAKWRKSGGMSFDVNV